MFAGAIFMSFVPLIVLLDLSKVLHYLHRCDWQPGIVLKAGTGRVQNLETSFEV
jgi:hypothetical protein